MSERFELLMSAEMEISGRFAADLSLTNLVNNQDVVCEYSDSFSGERISLGRIEYPFRQQRMTKGKAAGRARRYSKRNEYDWESMSDRCRMVRSDR